MFFFLYSRTGHIGVVHFIVACWYAFQLYCSMLSFFFYLLVDVLIGRWTFIFARKMSAVLEFHFAFLLLLRISTTFWLEGSVVVVVVLVCHVLRCMFHRNYGVWWREYWCGVVQFCFSHREIFSSGRLQFCRIFFFLFIDIKRQKKRQWWQWEALTSWVLFSGCRVIDHKNKAAGATRMRHGISFNLRVFFYESPWMLLDFVTVCATTNVMSCMIHQILLSFSIQNFWLKICSNKLNVILVLTARIIVKIINNSQKMYDVFDKGLSLDCFSLIVVSDDLPRIT